MKTIIALVTVLVGFAACSSVQQRATAGATHSAVQFKDTGTSIDGHGEIFATVQVQAGLWLVTGGLLKPDPGAEVSRRADLLALDTKDDVRVDPLKAPMMAARWGHRTTSLSPGRVFICGGSKSADCEIYVHEKKAFQKAGHLSQTRSGFAQAKLPDGRILLSGGYNLGDPSLGKVLKSAEIYDPKTNRITRIGDMEVARAAHQMWVSGQHVFVVGGLSLESALIEELDVPSLTFKRTTMALPSGLKDFQSHEMDENKYLVFGGTAPDRNSTTAILAVDLKAKTVEELKVRLSDPREDISVCPNRALGKVVIFGGETKGNGADGKHSGAAELFTLNPLAIERVSGDIYRDDSQVIELPKGGCLVVSGSQENGQVDRSILKIVWGAGS